MPRTKPNVTLIPGDDPDRGSAALDQIARVMLDLVEIPGEQPAIVKFEIQEVRDNGSKAEQIREYHEQIRRRTRK